MDMEKEQFKRSLVRRQHTTWGFLLGFFILCQIKIILMGKLLEGGDRVMGWLLLVGVILGGTAGMISRRDSLGGFWGDLVGGIIGSCIGGFLFKITDIFAYGTLGSINSSAIGALMLLWGIRMFRAVGPIRKKDGE